MNKRIVIGITGIFLMYSIPGKALAVWPPDNELEEEAKTAVPVSPEQNLSSDLPRPRELSERLSEDERRLRGVVQDLKKDEEDLKKSLPAEKPSERQ